MSKLSKLNDTTEFSRVNLLELLNTKFAHEMREGEINIEKSGLAYTFLRMTMFQVGIRILLAKLFESRNYS